MSNSSPTYFCHGCKQRVSIDEHSNCSSCGDPFVEFVEDEQDLNHFLQSEEGRQDMAVDSAPTSTGGYQANGLSAHGGAQHQRVAIPNVHFMMQGPLGFTNLIDSFIDNLFGGIATDEEERTQIHGMDGQFGSLEDFMAHILETFEPRGAPPASKAVVAQLARAKVSDDNKDLFPNHECTICQDDFEDGVEVIQMHCGHVFHPDCLLPWLERHNSCPVCREELPTDDPDYEATRRTNGGVEA